MGSWGSDPVWTGRDSESPAGPWCQALRQEANTARHSKRGSLVQTLHTWQSQNQVASCPPCGCQVPQGLGTACA